MDDAPFCSDSDCRVVNRLSAMLKDISQLEHGSRLTLSARCLQVLYEGFRHVQNASCVKMSHTHLEEKFFSSLTHLQDIMQNTKELLIFESGETLQGHVDCTDFSSITSLEVKCLPLYQLYGLSKVASHLSKMTCIGCINRTQELLELCGADAFRASDVLWSKLKEVHLAYNNLQSLDGSLKLVANLTHFDASHNNLNSTDDYLLVLNNLINLNLSYNSLRAFPEISRSANRHLTHLNLRNNLITSLKGLGHLFCLQYLDISNNLLTASMTLNNLKSLLMLCCLVLAGNPVSFDPSYRDLIIGFLHPAVIAQIKFDGQKLSKKEKKQFNQLQAMSIDASSRLASDLLESVDSVSSNCDSLSDSLRRSYRRRKPRLVEIVNQDESWQETDEFQKIENSMELYDSTRINSIPSSSCTDRDGERPDSDPRSSRAQASVASRASSSNDSRRRMKSKLRQITSPQLSSSNLDPEIDGVQNNISITGNRLNFVGGEDGDLSSRLDAEETKLISFNTDANEFKECADKDALPVTGKLIKDSRNLTDDAAAIATVTAEMYFNPGDDLNDKLSAGDCIYSTVATTDSQSEKATLDVSADNSGFTPVDASARNPTDSFQADGSILPSPCSTLVGKCPASVEERVNDVSASHKSPDDRTADSSRQLNSVSRSFSFNISNERVGNHNQLVEDDFYQSLGDCDAVTWQHQATDSNSLDVDSFNSEDVTLDSLMENGFEGDFLVYLIAGPRDRNVDDKCIVSIIGNWLYIRTTKDVIDRLDLHGLLAVQKVADHFSDYITRQNAKVTFDASFPGPVVRLLFDSLNQDKRERLFSMKDQNHGKKFARLLKSFIKTKPTAKMQCLRCDFHFDESMAKIVNADISEADIKRAMTFQGAGDRPVMHCPKCDSHFVIEVSERTGSISARSSQTMTGLNLAGDKISSTSKKRRKSKRGSVQHVSSSQTPGSLSSSFSFSFMRRRATVEDSLLPSDALQPVDGRTSPDDACAVDAIQFCIDRSEE